MCYPSLVANGNISLENSNNFLNNCYPYLYLEILITFICVTYNELHSQQNVISTIPVDFML